MFRRRFSDHGLLPCVLIMVLCGCQGAEPEEEISSSRKPEIIDTALMMKSCPTADRDILYDQELVITDARVVGDRCRTRWGKCTDPKMAGKWSFFHLARQAAGGDAVTDDMLSAFILGWLKTYTSQPVINGGDPLPKRAGILSKLVIPWRADSGCPADLNVACKLDFSIPKYQFPLLAIVGRMDLRGSGDKMGGGYGGKRAGEGRFIFAFPDPATGGSDLGTVIFEYALPARSDTDVLDWAKKWHALGKLTLGDKPYSAALQAVTDAFVTSGVQLSPSFNNGSALSRLRTNERAYYSPGDPEVQEFREFALCCTGTDPKCPLTHLGMQLCPMLTTQTPDSKYRTDADLARTLTSMARDVLTETHVIPDSYLSGAAQILPKDLAFRWRPPVADYDLRRLFALSTCTGCHFQETLAGSPAMQTGFHVDPTTGLLSDFLSRSITVADFSGMDIPYFEMLRRQCELQYLLSGHPSDTLTAPSGRAH